MSKVKIKKLITDHHKKVSKFVVIGKYGRPYYKKTSSFKDDPMRNPEILHIKSINADWCDNDIIMLHACFNLLADCIESEKLLTDNRDWNHNEEIINSHKELEDLYNWWMKRKKDDEQNKINDFDEAQYAIDNEMLIRLIKVRRYLWT